MFSIVAGYVVRAPFTSGIFGKFRDCKGNQIMFFLKYFNLFKYSLIIITYWNKIPK